MCHDRMTQKYRSIPRCYCSNFWQLFISFSHLSLYVSIFANSDVCSFNLSIEMRACDVCRMALSLVWISQNASRHVYNKTNGTLLFSHLRFFRHALANFALVFLLCNRTDVQRVMRLSLRTTRLCIHIHMCMHIWWYLHIHSYLQLKPFRNAEKSRAWTSFTHLKCMK